MFKSECVKVGGVWTMSIWVEVADFNRAVSMRHHWIFLNSEKTHSWMRAKGCRKQEWTEENRIRNSMNLGIVLFINNPFEGGRLQMEWNRQQELCSITRTNISHSPLYIGKHCPYLYRYLKMRPVSSDSVSWKSPAQNRCWCQVVCLSQSLPALQNKICLTQEICR